MVDMVNPTSAALQPAQQQAALQLFQQMRDNGNKALFVNPVELPAEELREQLRARGELIRLQIAAMDPADPNTPTLLAMQTTLEDANAGTTGLLAHTNTLINGDSSGSPISGGLTSNISQATSAMSLQNQMASGGLPVEGTSSSSDPCAIIGDFFNSIIGAGQELIAKINGLVQSAMEAVTQLINQINTAITAGMEALRQAINEAVGAIQAAVGEIKDMIAAELEAFTKWLDLGNLFNLSSFLSGIFNNQCVALVLNAVTPPQVKSILVTVQTGNVRASVAALGPIW